MRLTLLVAQAPKIQALNLKANDVIKNWYSKIGDFGFGIKVSKGWQFFQHGEREMSSSPLKEHSQRIMMQS